MKEHTMSRTVVTRGKSLVKLVAIAATVALTATVAAQNVPRDQLPPLAFTIPLNQPTPTDPKLTTGKLANGMRYYIRENKEPKNRAELRLVIDAGSILENDDQLGVAHVLEHMSFNGTEHFPKQDIVNFMESIGMRFGSDLNASTSFDETIYQLQVPTDKPEPLDKALQIMEDWAHADTLNDKDIDQERGVVAEEWRLGQGAGNRIRDKQLPVIMKNSRYASRLPIGTLDSIQHFDPKVLKQFYKDWYRPDLMAVVVVGDFNKTEVEKLVHQHFDGIAAVKNAKTRTRYDVPDYNDTLFSIVTDKEIPTTSVSILHKMPPITDWTPGASRQRQVESFYNTMLNQRFADMTRQPNAPFIAAQSGRGSLVRPVGIYQLAAVVQETGVKRGLEALLIEAEKVKRFGFNQAEFNRTLTQMQRGIDAQWARRDNRTSASHASEMIRNFLTGESIPGIEMELALNIRFLNSITLDEVNQVGKNWIKDTNRVVMVTMPQKDGLVPPTEADLKEAMADAARADIKPTVETTNDAPLVSSVPKGSKVTKTRALAGGITEWTLGNGVRVVLKPTDFKKDEIVFNSFSPGGTSLASDADLVSAENAVSVIASGGVGTFNAIDLQRKLTGKVASVSPYISDYEEGFRGNGSPADLETLLQLIYLRFTAPRADANMFQVIKTQMAAVLPNRLSNPSTVFGDAFNRVFYQNHPHRQPPSLERMQQLDLDKAFAFYKDRFNDASNYVFVFAGNIDPLTFQPLAETWLGGLPSTGRKETWKDVGIRYAKGIKEETVRAGKEPKANTRLVYSGKFDAAPSIDERIRLVAASEILQNRLREVLREQLGGTYGVSVGSNTGFRPERTYAVNIDFGSAPERTDELVNAVYAEIDKFKQNGPTDTELANQKATMIRSHESGERQNGTWVGQLIFGYTNDAIDAAIADYINYPAHVEKLTAAQVQAAYRQFFNGENRVHMTLLPEK